MLIAKLAAVRETQPDRGMGINLHTRTYRRMEAAPITSQSGGTCTRTYGHGLLCTSASARPWQQQQRQERHPELHLA